MFVRARENTEEQVRNKRTSSHEEQRKKGSEYELETRNATRSEKLLPGHHTEVPDLAWLFVPPQLVIRRK
jgi:hypothetical protein